MDLAASNRLISASIEVLDRRAAGSVGLFRVAANLSLVRDMLNLHKLGKPVDVAACEDPHVVAAFLLQLLRDKEPSLVDFNRVTNVEMSKDGSGPAATVVPLLRGLFAASTAEDIALCSKLCSLVNKLCQGQSNVIGMGGASSMAAASTAASLASIIGPALCRPPSSAFMSIRHKTAVPKIRDVIKAMFLHAPAVFTGLQPQAHPAAGGLVMTTPSRPVTVPSITVRSADTTPEDLSASFDSPPMYRPGPPKALTSAAKSSPPTGSPASPGGVSHKPSSAVHPSIHKAIDALIFFAVRDYVNNTVSSPLAKGPMPDVVGLNSGGSPDPRTSTAAKAGGGPGPHDGTACKNPYCPCSTGDAPGRALAHPSSTGTPAEWMHHETIPDILTKPASHGWTSQASNSNGDVDSLASSLDSVHLSSAPVLSPSMSRRLDGRRGRGPEPRTPPPTELNLGGPGVHARVTQVRGDGDEGLEGLGVTINSPVSETAFRLRPSATARRAQIAKCKSLRGTIREFEASFASEHGHQPRGPERTPLRNVYLQYRRLKQGVRENAATHIQMVYRGYSVRSKLVGAKPSPTEHSRPTLAQEHKLDDRADGVDATNDPASPATSTTESSGGHRVDTSGVSSSVSTTTDQLREEKSQLKQRLRAFDVEFKLKHGRMPSKADKEVIRHLYKRYHDVKALLVGMESASSLPAQPPTQPIPGTTGSGSSVTSDDETRGSGELSDSIRALQREKRTLQHHLRKFEEEFFKTHGRKVKFQKDITPVAEDYQRYKEIKTALAASTSTTSTK